MLRTFNYTVYQDIVIKDSKVIDGIRFKDKELVKTFQSYFVTNVKKRPIADVLKRIYILFSLDNRPTKDFAGKIKTNDIVKLDNKYYMYRNMGICDVTNAVEEFYIEKNEKDPIQVEIEKEEFEIIF